MPRTCLVTGASAGIGAAIAREYASRRWNLVLTARREEPMLALADELRRAHGTTSHVVSADLGETDAVRQLMATVDELGVRVDGLVNNAGYGAGGRFDARPWEAHETFLRVMLHAPTELAHAVLPSMKSERFGRIINVASVAGYLPGVAENNMYNATKSFLIKVSESLHAELADDGIHVSALCPGFTRTEFHDVAESFDRAEVDGIPGFAWHDAAEVARVGVEACETNTVICIPGRFYRSAAGVAKVLPSVATRKILGR